MREMGQEVNMKALKIVTGIISTCITLPIWFYLIYQILKAVNASELMWFLFWVYIPCACIVFVIREFVIKSMEESTKG